MKNQMNQCEKSEQTLMNEVKELPHEMTPSRNLWLGIERAIQSSSAPTSNKNNVFKSVALVASVIITVLISWISLSTSDTATQSLENNLIVSLSNDFNAQKKAVLVSFGQPDLKTLPSDMQDQLSLLSQARITINKALKQDVNNIELLKLLLFTQQQELNLLEKLLVTKAETPHQLQSI